LSSVIPRPPTSTLFPYTTLFRSRGRRQRMGVLERRGRRSVPRCLLTLLARGGGADSVGGSGSRSCRAGAADRPHRREIQDSAVRSEEHTSELQSQSNLVCRLLLE